MFTYEIFLLLHVTCVVVSGLLFLLRFTLLNLYPQQGLAKPLKVVPHIVDTVLLGAAIGMLSITAMNPFNVAWLTAKILALFAYILVGALCLRAAPASQKQRLYFAGAVAIYCYIVFVALTKQITLGVFT